MTKVGLYAIDKSTPLESNKSLGKDSGETYTALPVIMAMRPRQHGKGVV